MLHGLTDREKTLVKLGSLGLAAVLIAGILITVISLPGFNSSWIAVAGAVILFVAGEILRRTISKFYGWLLMLAGLGLGVYVAYLGWQAVGLSLPNVNPANLPSGTPLLETLNQANEVQTVIIVVTLFASVILALIGLILILREGGGGWAKRFGCALILSAVVTTVLAIWVGPEFLADWIGGAGGDFQEFGRSLLRGEIDLRQLIWENISLLLAILFSWFAYMAYRNDQAVVLAVCVLSGIASSVFYVAPI